MSITFTAAYGAGLSYWIYGLQSPPYGYIMEIPKAFCSLRQIQAVCWRPALIPAMKIIT